MIEVRPELIAFDLDGTLVDSAPDLARSVNAMLETFGRPPVRLEKVRAWIGNGTSMLVQRALTGELEPTVEPKDLAEALAWFLDFYAAHLCEHGGLFPGVLEGLRKLKEEGYKTACITNKLSRFTLPLLEQLGVSPYLDFIACGDQFGRLKPDPLPLLETARRLGAEPERSLMIGDSDNDVKAARAAGYGVLCVGYGYRGDRALDELGADGLIDSIADLPPLLKRLPSDDGRWRRPR